MYEYKAWVVSIYDADTIRFDIDLGFNQRMMNQSIRLSGINAWEVRGEQRMLGITARDAVRELLPKGSPVLLRTFKDKKGKYGRWIGTIILPDGTNLNEWLVEAGHAIEVEY